MYRASIIHSFYDRNFNYNGGEENATPHLIRNEAVFSIAHSATHRSCYPSIFDQRSIRFLHEAECQRKKATETSF